MLRTDEIGLSSLFAVLVNPTVGVEPWLFETEILGGLLARELGLAE